MNTAVLDELRQREPGYLPADVIESADDYHTGRVINDHVNSGAFFEGPDIAAFSADNAAFHIVARNVDGAYRRVGRVGGPIALDRRRQDFLGLFLGRRAKKFLALLNAGSDF